MTERSKEGNGRGIIAGKGGGLRSRGITTGERRCLRAGRREVDRKEFRQVERKSSQGRAT